MSNPIKGRIGAVQEHYERVWGTAAESCQLRKGPWQQLPPGFRVLKFRPSSRRGAWSYATCGMSCQLDANPIELHLFSPCETQEHVELLTCIAHYHLTGSYVDIAHTVNFGRPWLPNSRCDHGLVSLPYLDGPALEWLTIEGDKIRFLWLIPITQRETKYCCENGLEALEKLFEESRFNYLDTERESVV